MSEGIQFLTGKDLEYFQKLAERGEAVILTISEEEILSLDFSKPVKDLENEQINIQEELNQWVQKYKDEFRRFYGENQKSVEESRQIRKQIEMKEKRDEEVPIKQEQAARRGPKGRKAAKSASNLADYFAQVQLDPEKIEIINQAVYDGISEQEILLLLKGDYTADEMRKIFDSLSRNKKNS